MTRTIVVGGGTSGVVLAARLSEQPGREIVLIEAGPAPDPYPPELLDGTTVVAAMPGHEFNWSYQGNLTPDLTYTVARGRVLGGSSAVNGGYFIRARPNDFHRWAESGGSEWSFERVQPLLVAMEADRDFGGEEGHGQNGPMPVARPPQSTVLTHAFTEAALERGFPLERDKNAVEAPGVGAVPSNVVNGVRINTALAYLGAARQRTNLRVLAETRALRIRFEGNRAVGVDTDRGTIEGDEIILTAGSIATPHLLLSSGVGPKASLEALGIPVVSDLPVGESFSDHPDIAVGWKPNRNVMNQKEQSAFPTSLNFDSSGNGRYPDGDLEILLSVKSMGYLLTGPGSTIGGGIRQALRAPIRTAKALAGASVRRMATESAHLGDMQLIVGLQQPEGRGSLTLRHSDPLAPPRIDYRYLEEPSDLARMRTGIRTAVSLLRSDAFADTFDHLTQLEDGHLNDDEQLNKWMRRHLGTAIHLSGSAPMGLVVDASGRVLGTTGLRVADTSILPDVPSRGPSATAVLIGEVIARLIRDGR